MIYSIKSDKPSFKSIEFNPRFNVILADRTKESTKRDSRNGLGKSTLIEIIHFCLGANKGGTLSQPNMNGWTFILELDLMNNKYSIARNTSKPNEIIINGDCSSWPLKPDTHKKTGEQMMSRNNWNTLLGILMFGLNPPEDIKYTPTFRSLLSYIIRRNSHHGGFLEAFQNYKKQHEWDRQVNNAFLLELGWEFSAKLQLLKDKLNALEQIKQEAQSGILSDLIGTIGKLEALKIRLEDQTKQESKNLDDFKVHPQYSKIEDESNGLTDNIHALINLNITDKKLLEYYESSLKDEIDSNPEAVTSVYKEAGLILPKEVTKSIQDVLSFHKQVVSNRKDFLASEINRLQKLIINREQEKQNQSEKRAELMQILKKHKALEEYTLLQKNHQKTVSELNDVNFRLERLKQFDRGKSENIVEQELIFQYANTDLNERKSQKEKAILLFNSNSKALYDAPGNLLIDFKKKGFDFNIIIERSSSQGIENMKIFCYDLMLANIWAKKKSTPGFLIHDSIIFDGVDERQKALALQLAEKESRSCGFQYICTMNSDSIPIKDFDSDFNFNKYVKATFTDATENGGLLGIRF
ncbi:MAG: DUF2326 domain-containing protein [Planctomycetes bacterium]|nr:DUF2326 domain-containing protein [Planctomycetota bacterium]